MAPVGGVDGPPALESLATERLLLRALVPGDAAFILRLLNEPSFLRYIGDRGVRSEEDARAYIRSGPAVMYARHGLGLMLVQRRDTAEPIGMCGLLKRDELEDADLGFALVPEAWGQGYAREAAGAVLDRVARARGLRSVVAITSPDNEASGRLLEALGFRLERTMPFGAQQEPVRLFRIDL